MFLPDVPSIVLENFNGSINRLDPVAVPKANGLYALNLSYLNGEVGTRLGHSTVFAQSDGPALSMANWVFGAPPTAEVLYYVASLGVRSYIQNVATTFTPMAVTGAAGAVIVPLGKRFYAAFYDATGRAGTAGGQVYGTGVGADPLFGAPVTNVPTVTETAAGVVTAGVHRVGYLLTTRNGFTTKLCPVVSGTFAPVSFTATGSHNLHVVTPGTMPSYIAGGILQVVMTTTTNLNRYFAVPGATFTPVDSTVATTINLSISDDDLAATGEDVTSYMNLLTCGSITSPFSPPFNPSSVFAYSSRVGYVTFDSTGFPCIYMSDPNDYQHITANQHVIVLEGQAQPVHCFSMRGVCYAGTPFGFQAFQDNGGLPVTWTPPQKVDGSVGILSPTCVGVNSKSTYAGICTERGLYLFQGGAFPALPISYYQLDWNRIDWTKPTQVQVAFDEARNTIIVMAPLLADALGTPTSAAGTYRMVWDYTEGDAPETVKYSISQFANYNTGAMAVIQNIATNLNEVWYAPASAGPVIRQNDGTETHPYRDVAIDNTASAINCPYQTSLAPGKEDPSCQVHDFHGALFRVVGNGNLALVAKGLDGVLTITPVRSPLALSPNPGIEIRVKWFMRSEQQSIQFGTNAIDEFYSMSRVEVGYTNSLPQR